MGRRCASIHPLGANSRNGPMAHTSEAGQTNPALIMRACFPKDQQSPSGIEIVFHDSEDLRGQRSSAWRHGHFGYLTDDLASPRSPLPLRFFFPLLRCLFFLPRFPVAIRNESVSSLNGARGLRCVFYFRHGPLAIFLATVTDHLAPSM
jgi:hypothetical protein